MSGSGGSGGGYEAPTDSCELLVINTQLSSPKEEVVDIVQIGDVLDVATHMMGATAVVVVLLNGQIAGGLASPNVQWLRECMANGTQYNATVTDKNDGQVRVRVEAVQL